MLLLLFAGQDGVVEPPAEPTLGAGGGGSRRRIERAPLDLTPKETDRERAERIAAQLDISPAKAPERAVEPSTPAQPAILFDAARYQAELDRLAAERRAAAERLRGLQQAEAARLVAARERMRLAEAARQSEALAAIMAAAEAHAARLHEEDELLLMMVAM